MAHNIKPGVATGDQVQEIFNENKDYKYVDFIYKANNNIVNMRYATLIVETDNTN